MQRLPRYAVVALAATLLVSGGVGAALVGVGSSDAAGTAAALSAPAYASDSVALRTHPDHENGSTTDHEYRLMERFDLTEDQAGEIVSTVSEMWADGADRAEIRQAVREKLVEFGVDEGDLTGPTVEQRAERIAQELQQEFDLTDDQADEISALIVDMDEDGADRAEIRQAVREQLIAFGVDEGEIRDAWKDHRTKRFADNLAERFDITEEQAREVATEARTMRENGATWPEIYEMLETKLQSFGVSEAEIDDARIDHQISRLGCVLAMNDDLTDEERATILDEARTMLDDGASRQEVREMVREKLDAYDALGGARDGHDHDGHAQGPGVDRNPPDRGSNGRASA